MFLFQYSLFYYQRTHPFDVPLFLHIFKIVQFAIWTFSSSPFTVLTWSVVCTGKRTATVQEKEKDLLLIGQIFWGKISIFSKQILHHNSQRQKMYPHFGQTPLNNNAKTRQKLRIWNVILFPCGRIEDLFCTKAYSGCNKKLYTVLIDFLCKLYTVNICMMILSKLEIDIHKPI